MLEIVKIFTADKTSLTETNAIYQFTSCSNSEYTIVAKDKNSQMLLLSSSDYKGNRFKLGNLTITI